MIVNKFEDRDMGTIQKLMDSKFEFHLTGSRAFGCQDPEADYDFFVTECNEIKEWLQRHGFKEIEYEINGKDNHLLAVMQVFRLGRIDVQLVPDAFQKHAAQTILQGMLKNRMNELPKEVRSVLWRLALMAKKDVRQGQGDSR